MGVENIEVVFVFLSQLAPLTQQLPQAGLQWRAIAAVLHRDQQRADFAGSGQTPLQGAQRHHDNVVLIAHAALAFGLQQANDCAGKLLDAQWLA